MPGKILQDGLPTGPLHLGIAFALRVKGFHHAGPVAISMEFHGDHAVIIEAERNPVRRVHFRERGGEVEAHGPVLCLHAAYLAAADPQVHLGMRAVPLVGGSVPLLNVFWLGPGAPGRCLVNGGPNFYGNLHAPRDSAIISWFFARMLANSIRQLQGGRLPFPRMEVTLTQVRWAVFVLGPLVLVSYVAGIMRASDPEALWGGVTAGERLAIVPFMLLAAAGFLIFAYYALFALDAQQLASLRWPWGSADGNGLNRLLWAYVLYLVPSALWLESTLFHLNNPQPWTPALVVIVLTLVSVGIVMLGLLSWGAIQDDVPGAKWMLAGVFAMGFQSIVNDNIIWVAKFPW